MAKKAVALIVAGSGPVTEDEVNDLLLDRWPDDEWVIDLVVPVQKDYFTSTVEAVVDWYDDDEFVYPIREDSDSNLSRRSAKLGKEEAQEFDKITQVFNLDDFKDWDEVYFLVAMPEDPEDADYDLYAGFVEAAVEAEIPVLNLCRGLDDVRLEEPEPEPEPEKVEEEEEEEKPKRRSRAKKDEEPVDPDPVDEKPEESETVKKVKKMQEARAPETDPRILEVFDALQDATRYLRGTDEALQVYQQLDEPDYRPLTLKVSNALETLREFISNPDGDEEPAVASEPDKAAPKPAKDGTKRGRPRTQFIVNEVFDEDLDKWVPRPKGRLAKGTEWRKYNTKTDETVEEGTV